MLLTGRVFTSLFSLLSESRTFTEWVLSRYGAFPETGFDGDRLYPEHFRLAGNNEETTVGCQTSDVSTSMIAINRSQLYLLLTPMQQQCLYGQTLLIVLSACDVSIAAR